MPDLVLVQPPVEDFYLTAKRTIPYGLACIAGSLRERGFSVEILDCLAVNKSKPIPLPEAMAPLLDHYGKKDLSAFSLFHQFRHYGYSFEHAGTMIRKKKPRLVGISSLFTP
ncbi:MAG TPA: radical SAM protein, partial [Desulfobacteraceae bacterium]|nr:radical SAM protein [Desulfobacteraceae bacterium]